MASQVNKVIFKVEGDTSGITKALDKVDGKLEDVAEGAENVASSTGDMSESFGLAGSALDKMTGGAITGLKSMVGGVKSAIAGMKAFKISLASTGIGLLVVAIGSLVAFFTKSKRGADLLERGTAVLGAVVDKVVDGVIWLGEALWNTFTAPGDAIKKFSTMVKTFVTDRITMLMEGIGLLGSAIKKVFSGDFSGALEDAKDGFIKVQRGANPLVMAMEGVANVSVKVAEGVKEMSKEISAAITQADNLAKRSIALRQAQRDLNTEFAEGRAQIKELNLIAEDMSKPLEVRIDAAERAIAIEQDLMSERQRIAEEELAIHNEKMAMSESTEEDMERQNELEVALINIRTESAEMQTTLNNKLQTMRKAAADEDKRLHQEELDRQAELANTLFAAQEEVRAFIRDEKANEILEAELHLMDMFQVVKAGSEEEQRLIDAHGKKLDAINAKWNNKEIADEQAVQKAKFKMASDALGALMALNQAFAKDGEEGAKKAFQRNKRLSQAQATINTYAAVADALAKDAVFPGSRFIAAAAAGAMGLAQVVSIGRTEYQGSTTPTTPSVGDLGGGGFGGGGSQPTAPQIDFGFLGGGSEQTGVQAYVISQNVTNSQQANQLIQDQVVL